MRACPEDLDARLALIQALRPSPEQAWKAARAAEGIPRGPAWRRAEVRRLEAEIDLDRGEEPAARRAYARALELEPGDLDALAGLARLEKARPREAHARARLASRAAAEAPGWYRPQALLLSAGLWRELGVPGAARADLERALESDPDALPALEALAAPDVAASTAAAAPDAGGPASGPWGEAERLRRAAEAALAAGRREAAAAEAEALDEAIPAEPAWRRVPAYRMASALWLSLDDHDRALELLRAARELDKESLATRRPLYPLAQPGEEHLSSRLAVREITLASARAWRRLGRVAGAEAAVRRGLLLVPEDPVLLRELVAVLLARGAAAEALPYAERMLNGSGQSDLMSEVRRMPDSALRSISAEFAADVGRERIGAGGAERFARAARTERLAALRTMAQVRLALGDPRAALRALDRAPVSSDSGEEGARLLLQRARVEEALGRELRARRSLARALALAPEDGEARALAERLAPPAPRREPPLSREQKAAALKREAAGRRAAGDLAGADLSLTSALQLDADTTSLRVLADIKEERARPEEALDVLRRLEKALADAPAPRRADVLREQGRLRNRLGETGAADAAFEAALALDPADLETLWALLEPRLARPDSALSLLARRWPRTPSAAWLVARAVARRAAGNDAGSRDDQRAALDADASGACAPAVVAKAAGRLGSGYFGRCLERRPADGPLWLDRGMAYFAEGRLDEAIADFRKAVALLPGSREAADSLAAALELRGASVRQGAGRAP